MIEVTDAIHRQVCLARPAKRIVSLVPSETLSVADLVGIDKLVGRTDFCVEPMGRVEAIRSVGGTKGFDIDAVRALRPDLVLANKEENSRPSVQALIDSGMPVHVSFPCTVDESLAYLRNLCALLGVDPMLAAPLQACRDAVARARAVLPEAPLPVFVPIWKDPWMTFDDRAYASDMLEVCGATNVFAERKRRYPLAADLGKAKAHSNERVAERDTRYPRIRIEEVVERGARASLLPDEPYAFGDDDAAELELLDARPRLVAKIVDGKNLFWYGTHVARAVERLVADVAELRTRTFGSTGHN